MSSTRFALSIFSTALLLSGCEIGQGIKVGPVTVTIDVGEFALGKVGTGFYFELGDALIGIVPLCEVVAAADFDAILREEVDSSAGNLVTVTEVILTSIVLRFPTGLPGDAETLTLIYVPAGEGFTSLGLPSRVGSAQLLETPNGAIEIFAESEFDLLPLLEGGGDREGGPCPLLLIVLDPFTTDETVVVDAILNADAYGEISLGALASGALNLSGAGN